MSDSFATPWAVAHQGPLSMVFSRQEYWNGMSLPPPGYLPDPGIEPSTPMAPALLADSQLLDLLGKPIYTCVCVCVCVCVCMISPSIQSLSMLQPTATVIKQTQSTDYNILGLYYHGKGKWVCLN